MNMLPKQIVEFLDEYVIGQKSAKKTIAIALRNRHRRMKLSCELQDEVVPKNILMIGSTGVGKTEISRRIAKSMGFPFIKVEASKYTQVGYVGRDVEGMVRDLAKAALKLVKDEVIEKNKELLAKKVEDKILDILLPALPKGISAEKQADYDESREKLRSKLAAGELDSKEISIEVSKKQIDVPDNHPMAGNMQQVIAVMGFGEKKVKKTLKIKDAKKALESELESEIINEEALHEEALRRAENEGIIFIDEIDKIAVGKGESARQDPGKEGVQRDLLPIVEGSTVSTCVGQLKTDHILFIAAGAFHYAKPSDLIPELQGRFPLRVELDSLGADELYEILTRPKNSLVRQYVALLGTEGINLRFEDAALRRLAAIAHEANAAMDDIGARRLHTVIEKLLEEVSFASEPGDVVVDEAMVQERLGEVVKDQDLARYIL